ncbi:hypothetical protein F5X96DRAFT_683263 [Biscogniauxia mediterranea]|nr:hypothetical protein F5X96DRAFT_683263 [Biscogniauxia mediterranea]
MKRGVGALHQTPGFTIFHQPVVALPAALGLAGFAGSTWITSSSIANWWGTPESPTLFFPFVGIFGGLAQLIAGLYGFKARDPLVTVIHTMWGSFRAAGALQPHSAHTRFPELASWFVILCVFTWSCALAATARDIVLRACLFSLAIGSTIACCLFAYNGGTGPAPGDGLEGGVAKGTKAASYFWVLSTLLAWWRVTVYLVEEAYGPTHDAYGYGKRAPLLIPGLGEPDVK